MKEALIDDPKRRRPDISKAKEVLQWQPRWELGREFRRRLSISERLKWSLRLM